MKRCPLKAIKSIWVFQLLAIQSQKKYFWQFYVVAMWFPGPAFWWTFPGKACCWRRQESTFLILESLWFVLLVINVTLKFGMEKKFIFLRRTYWTDKFLCIYKLNPWILFPLFLLKYLKLFMLQVQG